jgi:ATP-dependent DNA helicase PIF1
VNDAPLSTEQQAVFDAVLSGKNVFFTGNAGTGKSFVLRKIVEGLKAQFGSKAVNVTAPTGTAACNIGGMTIHSFAGIGIGREDKHELADRIKSNRYKRQVWRDCGALVIDEISMLDGDLFDKLNHIAKEVKNCRRPFGGIRLVVCGDFLQLPPIGVGSGGVHFAFESEGWAEALDESFILTIPFRQSDPELLRILNEVRNGTVTQPTVERLRSTQHNNLEESGMVPTTLHSHNREVDSINMKELQKLHCETRTYAAEDWYENSFHKGQLEKNCLVERSVSLKEGAQVMLLKNIDVEGGLANGTRGVVIGFEISEENTVKKEEAYPRVRFRTPDGREIERVVCPEEFSTEQAGKKVSRRQQVPLRLAWAMSIHKSQGATISLLKVNASACFDYGQVYVALSRCTSLESLQCIGFDPQKARAHPKVLSFYQSLGNGRETSS